MSDQRHTKGYSPRVRAGTPLVKGRFGLWRFGVPRSVWQNDEMITKRSAFSVFSAVLLSGVIFLGWNDSSESAPAPSIPPTTVKPVTTPPPPTVPTTTIPATTTTTIPPFLVDPETPCQEWLPKVLEAGWPADRQTLDRLFAIMWRESRCHTDSWNRTDPSSGSRGLLQINGFWCRPNSYTDRGFLQDHGVLNTCDDLFDPEINLKAGYTIWVYGVEKHGCGWGPWAMGCR